MPGRSNDMDNLFSVLQQRHWLPDTSRTVRAWTDSILLQTLFRGNAGQSSTPVESARHSAVPQTVKSGVGSSKSSVPVTPAVLPAKPDVTPQSRQETAVQEFTSILRQFVPKRLTTVQLTNAYRSLLQTAATEQKTNPQKSIITTAEKVQQPGTLRVLLDNNGVFYEAKLANYLLSAQNPVTLPDTIGMDSKLLLLRLLSAFTANTGSLGGAAPEQNIQKQQTGNHPVTSQSGKEQEILPIKILEGLLARKTTSQIQHLVSDYTGNTTWLFDIPFEFQKHIHNLHLRIEQEQQSLTQETNKQFRVVLHVELQRLGPVTVEIYLMSDHVTTIFTTHNESSRRLLSNKLDCLLDKLEKTTGMQQSSFCKTSEQDNCDTDPTLQLIPLLQQQV